MTLNSRSAKLSSPNVKVQDVPNVPTIGAPSQDTTNELVNVEFTPAATGGRAAVYRAISTPGNIEAVSYGSSPVQVPGLAHDTAYTFNVRGETATGATTGYTASSSPITTNFGAYELIGTQIATSNLQLVDFTSIPQNYKHLQIRYTARDTGAFTSRGMFLEVNGNTVTGSNSQHYMRENGSNTFSNYSTNIGRFDWSEIPAANATANAFTAGIIDILNYTNTSRNKTFKNFHGHYTTSTKQIELWSGLWASTAAISSLRIYSNNSFATGSRISLYGIKG